MLNEHPVTIIAEASGNHHKNYDTAIALVEAAAEAGADVIKFQLFTAETLCVDIPLPFGHSAVADAWFARMKVSTMRELFSKGSIPRKWCLRLKEHAESCGIDWMCTPFSLDEARFLVEAVGVKALKIASGDLTFEPLIRYAGTTGLPTFLSTGGAYLREVRQAAGWFLESETAKEPMPIVGLDSRGRPKGIPRNLTLLHCVSAYPCPPQHVNLKAIRTISNDLSVDCGFSDHTLDVGIVPALAVAYGATCYEKHLKLRGDDRGVDVEHSITPGAFKSMVEVIRQVPTYLGDGIKVPHASEMHDRLFARRDPSDWLRPQMRGRMGDWE